MPNIHILPAEILAVIFSHEGLADITRQVCKRWRGVALPIWLRRLTVLPSDPFKDRGFLNYLKSLTPHDRLFVRALDISSRRQLDSASNTFFYEEVADDACVQNVLMIQSLLGARIMDISLTDTGWDPEGLDKILRTILLTTRHLNHFQLSLFDLGSYLALEFHETLVQLLRRDACRLKSLTFDLALSLPNEHWESIAECTELESFHLGLPQSAQPILTDILEQVLPKWKSLSALYICQARFVSAETIQCLYKHLPYPSRLRELRLIFEACQASVYQQEFIEMIHAMPNLQILEAHLDWTNRMMEHVALSLPHLRELSITCSNPDFTCAGIEMVAWGQALEKVNMRICSRISSGFINAVRKRSSRVRILVYGSMKWGGTVDEWE
ncbi:hypothetical protein B0O80DRAFT_496845 [Mortierella sp. GBAus27b]|nr:hypothetical protein BGX31_005044 [Mortierella sp. GBA43]KAI8357129.1 hypothetical protein B0O80DRAFT_496845 [Mortierella sp. GBAus27b]